MANGDCVLVFLETSLDTRLVVCSTNDDTIASLKRKIEAEHVITFPVIGEVIVRAVKTFRDGMMFHLVDSMPVSAVLVGVNGNFLLYIDIEAVTTNDKRILRDGRVDKEVKVPIGGSSEDLMLSKAPSIDKQVSVDPLHDSAKAPTHVLNKKTKKKKRKKNLSSEDTALRLEESRKGEAEGSEGNSVQEEPANDEAGETKHNYQAKGDDTCCDQPDDKQMLDQGREVSGDPAGERNQSSSNYVVAKLGEEQARRDDTKKAPSPQEASQMIDAVLGGVAREKKKHKKTQGFSSDDTSEVPTIKENEPQVKHNIQVLEKKYSKVPEKTGGTTKTPHSVSSALYKSQGDQEGNLIADKDTGSYWAPCGPGGIFLKKMNKDTGSYNQPQNDQNVVSDIIQQCRKENADELVLKESAYVVGGDPGFISPKKKRKKTKAVFMEASSQERSSRENRSYKGKTTDALLEKETSMAGDTNFINNAGGTTKTPHSVSSALYKSQGDQEGNLIADKDTGSYWAPFGPGGIFFKKMNKDTGSYNQPQNDQNVVSDIIQQCRKENADELVLKESAYVVGGDPGFISPKKKRKKTKAVFLEASSQEWSSRENRSYKGKTTDALLEKETSMAGDTNFINNADNAAEKLKHDTDTSGMDATVKEKSRKKHKKTNGPSADIPCEVPPIRGDEVEKANDKVHKSSRLVDKKRNSGIPLKSAEEVENDTHTSGMDETVQKYRKKRKRTKAPSDIPCDVPPIRGNESEKADDKVHEGSQLIDKARNFKIPLRPAEEVKNDTHTSGMDEVVREKSRKKHKKTKGPSSDISCEVPPVRGDESEKVDDKFHKGNRLVDNKWKSEIPLRSAVGGGAEADNSVPCKLDMERLQPQISSPADEDVEFHDQLRQQASMGDSKDESRKGAAHVTGWNPGGFSVEKKSCKKKKAASSEGLVDNRSCPERENDTILEKEISKEDVDPGLIRITGRDPEVLSVEKRNKKNKAATDGMGKKQSTKENESYKERESNLNMEKELSKEAGDVINSAVEDPGVACREKRKHKKTKAAAADVSSRELSSTKNDSSKERKSSLIIEKEASNNTRDAHFAKTAGDVAFPAPNCSDPDDSVNKIVSGVLADLKERSSILLDTRISKDAEPYVLLLTNVAVEQASGVIVKAKKETRQSKIESSNKTETSQDTTSPVTGDSVIASDDKKRYKAAELTSLPPERENGIDSRESFDLAISSEAGARNQMLGSIIEEDSVNDGNKNKIKDQEAKTLGPEVTTDGAAVEANGTIKDYVTQTDGSDKIETQTMIKKSVKEDNVAADLTFGDEKSKCKPREEGVTDKHGVTSFAEETTENAPTTPEKMQKSVDNFLAEKQDKEAFAEGIQTKGPAILHKTNKPFLPQPTEQPSDASSPLKETKVNKKIQNNPLSKDKSKSHTSLSNNVSKRDDEMKCLVANMAVMSDASSEYEEEANSQLKRPMSAVRKVSAKRLGEKVHASRKNSAMVSSGSCFDDLASEALTRDESGSANKDSPMPEKKEGRAMMSPSSHWKDEGIAEDDLPMSQESTKPTKKVDLSSVLMGSSCYKKAEVSASQSQADDRDMFDVVFETQPDDVS